jgi:hypothetical protein
MPPSDGNSPARTSSDFVQSSILEAVVPFNETIDIGALFQAWNRHGEGNEESLIPFVEQRHFLMLGKQYIAPLMGLLSYSSIGV